MLQRGPARGRQDWQLTVLSHSQSEVLALTKDGMPIGLRKEDVERAAHVEHGAPAKKRVLCICKGEEQPLVVAQGSRKHTRFVDPELSTWSVRHVATVRRKYTQQFFSELLLLVLIDPAQGVPTM